MIESTDLFHYAGMLDQGKRGFFDGTPDGPQMKGKRLAMGLCISCKKPRESKAQRCRDCMKKAMASNADRKRRVALSGACQKCHQPWKGESLNCPSCLAAFREKAALRSIELYCSRCASPRDSAHKACLKCRIEMRKLAMKRRGRFTAKGLCAQCAKHPSAEDGKLCVTCVLKAAARRWLGDSRRWPDLLTLFEQQDHQCAYTGEPIAIGGNASVDHKNPRSKGGVDAIENLHWTSWIVNRAKTDTTHEDFLNMCRAVARRYPE